jgi:hypothetical protein
VRTTDDLTPLLPRRDLPSGGGSGFFWLGLASLGLGLAGAALVLVLGRTSLLGMLGQLTAGFAMLGLGVTWIVALTMAAIGRQWLWLLGVLVCPPAAIVYHGLNPD